MERALEVGVEHRVPIGVREPQQEVVPREPGVVHQDVDGPERGFGRGDGGLDLDPIRDVAGEPGCALAQLGGDGRGPGLLAAHDGDLGARTVEGARNGKPDAAGAAGDEGDLAGEIDGGHGPVVPSEARDLPRLYPEAGGLPKRAAKMPRFARDDSALLMPGTSPPRPPSPA